MRYLLTLAAISLSSPVAAQQAEEQVTPASVVAAALPEEWVNIAPEDVLIMELAPAADGSGRYVVIQLMPPPFSQPWVENIRTLARAGWWDELSVYRAVDNWVVQWGDVSEEKALPEGLADTEAVPYVSLVSLSAAKDDPKFDPPFQQHNVIDPYANRRTRTETSTSYEGGLSGFSRGWPVAMLPDYGRPISVLIAEALEEPQNFGEIWPIHCYSHVGVARDIANTGTGTELYAVIGHAPRQLDRNIAVVGRVIEGMEFLSTLPRGPGDLGVYESRQEDTPIVSVQLASDHRAGATFAYEYLDTASESFARYVDVRANRNDDFYTVPAGGVDICNVQVPVRLVAP